MTIKDLSSLQSLDALIYSTTNRIHDLDGQLHTIRTHGGASQPPETSGLYADAETDFYKQRSQLEDQLAQYKSEKQRIIAFIDTVEDCHTRSILTLRFIGRMTWGDVAKAIGGRNTGASVKQTCYRFLRAQ